MISSFDEVKLLLESTNDFNLEEIVLFCIEKGNSNFCTSLNKTLLHFAAERGDLFSLRRLLECGADVNTLDKQKGKEFYFTPLHYACSKGHLETADLLLTSGAHINALGESGRTAVFAAVSSGNMELFEFLVSSTDADIFHEEWDHRTLLHEAVAYDQMPIFDRLIQLGLSPVNSDLLVEACKWTASYTTIEKIFALGLEDDAEGSAFCQICAFYPPQFVELFLKNGAKVDKPDSRGLTPLNCAIESGRVGNVRVLLDSGAEIDSKSFSSAFWIGNEEIIGLLNEGGKK